MSEFPKTVRTTFRPDEDVEVGEAEYTDLKRQGLLVEQDEKETGEAAPADEKPTRERARRDQ